MDSSNCIGCDEDFYNGKNPYGVKECWHLKDAKLVTKYAIGVQTMQDKKENFWEVTVPNCYRRTNHFVYYSSLPEHLKEAS